MTAWRPAAIELTRRLAGRLPDTTLGPVRSLLGAGEQEMMSRMLVGGLVREGVPLDSAEFGLLEDSAGGRNRQMSRIVLDPDAGRLRYRFVQRTTGPVLTGHPRHVLAWARASADARAVYQTWRQPLSGAAGAAGWVYLLEIYSDADVAAVQAAVQDTPGSVGVEVIAVGETLPPYQSAALAAATQLWP